MYNNFMEPSSSPSSLSSPLEEIEPRLRTFLPADLYAAAWVDPSPTTLERVFEHLRTLQRILYDYTPRKLAEDLLRQKPRNPDADSKEDLLQPRRRGTDSATGSQNKWRPGQTRHEWQKGSLMFTDLAGFTKLMEANATRGHQGAEDLLAVLNAYFAEMIEIISKSNGDLLEFTGDALLAVFPETERKNDALQAVRAGLRMQRAMARFAEISTPEGILHLGMRVGIHSGRFLSADIGTPRRMEHVLLGKTVQQAKLTESAGQTGRVNLSNAAYEKVKEQLRFDEGKPGYKLVVDDLSDVELGEYEITPGMRIASSVMIDRGVESFVRNITDTLRLSVEPLGSFIPQPVLNLLVESAANRHIPPDFPQPTVVFVNFIGLPELVDRALPGEEERVIKSFSNAFAQINAAVEARGGVLKKVTYHLSGSDIVIYFGVPTAHTNDPIRAAHTALAIRDVIMALKSPTIGNVQSEITCQIGINMGPAFSAEIGNPRGRREFNLLGDTVNTAARLMNQAGKNQIFIAASVYKKISSEFKCKSLGKVSLKGKSAEISIYELIAPKQD